MKNLIQLLVSHSISLFYSWIVIGFSYNPDSVWVSGENKKYSSYWLSLLFVQLELSNGNLKFKLFGTKKPFQDYLEVDFKKGTYALNEYQGNSSWGANPKPIPFMRKRARINYSHIN